MALVRSYMFVTLTLLVVFASHVLANKPCNPRKYDQESVVCVCNETYCDNLDEIQPGKIGEVQVYESGSDGKRFESTTLKFKSEIRANFEQQSVNYNGFQEVPNVTININPGKQYQEMFGFGGAFTDAAGINIATLPQEMQDTLIKDYFSKEGLEYNIGRIPMASCDFSTHPYSYADVVDDFELKHFQLAEEDFKYKIPYIQKAKSISSVPILMFASPWSSPYWMKSNNKMNGKGILKGEVGGKYYQTWANYFVKFLQSYQAQNISIWGLTAENEPSNGFVPNFSFQSLGFTAETQRDFIGKNLGPTLEKAGFGVDKVKLMILDDQRLFMPKFIDKVLENPVTNKYVSGVAFHWYLNYVAPAKLLDITHNAHPEKFLFASEACYGDKPWDYPKVALGSWHRGEAYALDIIQDLQHWTTAWVDWNLALDLQGGPNWVKNFVDAPIIINANAKEYYKQPMFYVLGHFSKFISRKSVHVDAEVDSGYIELNCVVFKRPDGAYVLVALNRNTFKVNLKIHDARQGYIINEIQPSSIQTYIWWNNEK